VADQRPAPAGVDVNIPNVARMYDYYLGGKDNYAADRETADQVLAVAPQVRTAVQENRGFLARAVSFLAGEAGIGQFLDIGSGLPTQRNVHEIAASARPGSRVVYSDYDPVVVTHGDALLSGPESVSFVRADVRRPDLILDHPEVRRLIDFRRPVAVLLVAILNFVRDDEDPAGLVAQLRDVMAPGSYLVLSHGTREKHTEVAGRIEDVYDRSKATAQAVLRTHDQILPFFDGFELVPPGLVYAPQWRPDAPRAADDPGTGMTLAGVGRLR
jgi:SAM-dependent methyltransferase